MDVVFCLLCSAGPLYVARIISALAGGAVAKVPKKGPRHEAFSRPHVTFRRRSFLVPRGGPIFGTTL